MKPHRSKLSRICSASLVIALATILPSQSVSALTTDLANIPLVNATTATVLPNIWFVLDDSGSMAWDYLPDDAKTSGFWDSPHCNGLAYNPAISYAPPIKHDGTSYANSSFSGAWVDGYSTGSGTTNLATLANQPIYYLYSGTETDLDFTYSAGIPGTVVTTTNFYKECNSSLLSTTITLGGSGTTQVTGITVNGVQLMSGASTSSSSIDTVGASIATKINLSGYRATYSSGSNKLTITTGWPYAAGKVPVVSKTGSMTFSASGFPALSSTYPGVGKFVPYEVGAAEQQNYANWYSYYRTRILMAKTAIGFAFNDIRGWPLDTVAYPDDVDHLHARVGFTTIHDTGSAPSNTYLPIADFNSALNTIAPHTNNSQKQKFYTSLYAQGTNGSTPLRGALSKAGRLYAGKLTDDPVQYSCQKNFTILMTDGYWNKGDDTSSYTALNVNNQAIGDVDGAAGVPFPSYDAVHSLGSLADVAYYYYQTDLRPGSCAVCVDNVPPSSSNLSSTEEDVASWQHMTTYTVGLGLNGRLKYDQNYKSQTSGDYFDIKQGAKPWPDPSVSSSNSQVIERVDDLWHAAVNGRGLYLSAKNPAALQDGLIKALGSIAQKVGAGAAAGTSSLNPVPGDSSVFVATYTTAAWSGDLNAYDIDLQTGLPKINAPLWSASPQLAARIPSPGASESPVRNIKTGASPAAFKDFQWGNLTAAEKAFLDNTKLSQYADWDSTQLAVGTGQNLLNYLRGWYQYEQATGSPQLYRSRLNGTRFNLGDIAHSQPVYVKKPPYNFGDAGYADFKLAQANRAGTVYVSSNDGMVHAFNGATGAENWAYVPPMVLPQLWRLADQDYANRHVYFVDGPLTATDVFINGAWKTVLLGAMGKGARGYFALDITDPLVPKMLWSFTADPSFSTNPADSNYYDANIGYAYGAPLAAKVDINGTKTWVAVMTSGYNNVPETAAYPGGPTFSSANGKGYLYVVDMATGKKLKTISTDVGSVTSPSGLSKINLLTDNFTNDNSSDLGYGGDLLGNLWRFKLSGAGSVTKLFSTGVSTQPITVAPEIGMVGTSTKVVYFGTGRYLGQSDLVDQSVQAIYAIRDDDSGSTISGTSTLVQQTQSVVGGQITANPGSFSSGHNGWYVNLKGLGERIAVDPQLHLGVLIMSSTIPVNPSDTNASACTAGGSGVVYELDYSSGASLAAITVNSPPVGVSPIQIKHTDNTPDKKVISILGGDGTLVTKDLYDLPGGNPATTTTMRIMWRELSN